MQKQAKIGGVVLAGGKSSRMQGILASNKDSLKNIDKATLRLLGKQSLLENNISLVGKYCAKVWVSCREDNIYEDYLCVPDVYKNAGPVAGLHSSLIYAKNQGLDAILVLACDMPAVQSYAIEKLLHVRKQALDMQLKQENIDFPMLTVFCEQDSFRIQTLLAIYEVGALPLFSKALSAEQQERKLSKIIPPKLQQRIFYNNDELAEIFINLNTPNDVENYLQNSIL